CQKYISAPLTF
nr:immunoglobulin light chain junction region [Macaca mulatta]MOV34896.1 immunoglobulin light chain junction region [Macaca mulatta]MOV34958.1 immunoglobulin light chain junction region [Macaca mulatta]MOV35441.1 immunoglobulin light chain junction region [Macaca mulatta]MOW08499.1 immunoglobulin light chain junction region [Macaca mulatta]